MKNLHVCVFTNFLKYLEFSDFKRPILNIDLKNTVFECIGSRHALTVTRLHLRFAFCLDKLIMLIGHLFMFISGGQRNWNPVLP